MTDSRKHPAMIIRSQDPLNLETPLGLLGQNAETRASVFYVRNHGVILAVDPDEYRLHVCGLVDHPLELSLRELREQFPTRTMEATLHCAGNRRDELARVAPIPDELIWSAGAIGNARWSGVPLAEVLKTARPREGAQHAAFSGLDEVEGVESPSFGGSIPLHKALGPEALLAHEMNGEPLAVEHGSPLRVVVPGYIGARSVKWLDSITLQEGPSENHFQAKSYRLFPPYLTDEEAAEDSEAFSLGEISVNAVIFEPRDGERMPAGRLSVRGVAVAGGGRSVERVDITADGGRSWTSAELSKASAENHWAWRRWWAELSLEPGMHHIAARAVDSAADMQPEDAASLWNIKGYANNAWPKVRLQTL